MEQALIFALTTIISLSMASKWEFGNFNPVYAMIYECKYLILKNKLLSPWLWFR